MKISTSSITAVSIMLLSIIIVMTGCASKHLDSSNGAPDVNAGKDKIITQSSIEAIADNQLLLDKFGVEGKWKITKLIEFPLDYSKPIVEALDKHYLNTEINISADFFSVSGDESINNPQYAIYPFAEYGKYDGEKRYLSFYGYIYDYCRLKEPLFESFFPDSDFKKSPPLLLCISGNEDVRYDGADNYKFFLVDADTMIHIGDYVLK